MKKITSFILGLLIILPLSASDHYTLEEDGTYTYTGEPVSVINIDFTSWTTSDLPGTFTDDMALAEHQGLGFVKWKIASRSCGDKGQVNALFNNNNSDFSGGPANPSTTNKPRIYLPTTSNGVVSIKVFAGGTGVYMPVYYKDDDHTEWTLAGSLPLTLAFAEYSLNLNTKGQTSIYIEYTGTAWPAITNLSLDMKEASVYNLVDAENHIYEYTGTAVNAINIDFSTWATSDLPATLSDDMELTEKDGLGFIKWKIASRSCGEKGTVNALFNNNNSDFSSGPANTATTNPPRIYLPTTTRGVKNIKVFGGFSGSSGSVSVGVRYKDASHTAWTWGGGLVLPYSYAEVSLVNDLNTTGQTSIYLEYITTPYPAITNLQVELRDDAPTAIDNTNADTKVTKLIENGQLVIIKNGVRYNVLGTQF